MSSRKRNMDELRAVCAELHPDDGIDPRQDKRARATTDEKPDRKTRQLCKQVAQTLQLALSALPDADQLAGVTIWAVNPAPNAGHLCVVLAAPAGEREILALVRRHAPRLRAEVAAAITRRRAPELSFEVIAKGGQDG